MTKVAIAVLFQIMVGIVTGARLAWVPPSEPNAVFQLFVASCISQCTVLAAWVSASRAPLWKRALALICGTFYLWLLVTYAMQSAISPDQRLVAFVVVACSVCTLTGSAVATRNLRPGLAILKAQQSDSAPGPVQFSLRHIMTIVLAISIAIASSELLRVAVATYTLLRVVIVCAVLMACLVELSCVALWAVLSPGRIKGRLVTSMTLTLVTAFVPTYYFDMSRRGYAFYSSVALESQVLTIAVLLAVRSCGYRLVLRESPDGRSYVNGG